MAVESDTDENGEGLCYTTDELAKQDLELIERIINEDDIDLVGTFSFNNPVYYE